MDATTKRILVSGAFALALYFAIGEAIDVMALPAIGFVWTLFALHAAALATGGAKVYPASASGAHLPWLVFDVAVLVALFLSAWWWTAFAYAGSCGCAQLVGARPARRS